MKKISTWLFENKRLSYIVIGFAISVMFGFIEIVINSIISYFLIISYSSIKLFNGKHSRIFRWIQGDGYDWSNFFAAIIGTAIGLGLNKLVCNVLWPA